MTPRKRDAIGLGDLPCERHRRLAWLHPASSLPDVEVHEHANADAARRAPLAIVPRVLPSNRPRPSLESAAPSAATRAHFSGVTTSLAISTSSQNSAATSASADRRTRQSGARPGRQLTSRDLRRLMRLEMRPKPAGPSAKNAAMRAMLRSSAAKSRTRAGVWISLDLCRILRDILVVSASWWA